MRLYRWTSFLAAALSVSVASAARIGVYDAACAARAFVAEGRHLANGLASQPREVREHAVSDGSRFFSVRLSGGGTVFLSGDDEREPVIAYSSDDVDYDSLDPASPLRALLERDASVRRGTSAAAAKWRRLLAKGDAAPAYPSLLSAVALSASSLSSPGDIRVPAILKTKWGQDNDRHGNPCFNLDTPDNDVCGCVATAMSQVMRHHRWPDAGHPVTSANFQCYVDDAGRVLTTQGGIYDWDLMPSDTTGDYIASDEQRVAIGKLASDAGISVRMQYSATSSSTFGFLAANAFTDTWRYGQATYFDDGSGYIDGPKSSDNRQKALSKVFFSNFDAGCPVIIGITGTYQGYQIGHCVVADGYGYDGDVDYVHLNLGWSGGGDLWYNLPTIDYAYGFSSVCEAVYNVFPTNDTSSASFSGRIVNAGSEGLADAEVTILKHGTTTVAAKLTSSASGVYGAVLPAKTYYDVVAVSSDLSLTGTVANVYLSAPAARSKSYTVQFATAVIQKVFCNRTVSSGNEIGNSWGNDIVLDDGLRKEATNFYVSASLGLDAPDRGTCAAPYATIQYAVTNGQRLVSGDVFNVLPGTYHGCVTTPETEVSIVSTDGPEVTILDGDGRDCCYYGVANVTNLIAGFTITNGAYYGGIYGGTASNCVIVKCSSSASDAGCGGGACGATLVGCVLHNNEAYYGGGAAACRLVNCTVYDNWAQNAGGGVDVDCFVTNSIVWRNWATNDDVVDNWEIYKKSTWGGTVVYKSSFAGSCTYPDGFTDLGGNITNDPKCVSFDVDDWRLRVGSPCLGTALDGSNRGAWQGEPVDGYVITARAEGRGSVSPWAQFVSAGDDATFTAVGDHPLVRFETNGVFASSEREYVWRDVWTDGELTAVFGVTNYWLDAENGDDANDGLSPASPLRTVYATVQKAGRGDRVDVRPGVYAGCDWCAYEVEMRATEGPAATVVDGGGTNRCVYAEQMLYRGFTFRNGNAGTNADLSYGGGAYGGTFVDCVFSNCTAYYGGAVAGATLTNCLVVGNAANRYRSGYRYYGGFGGGVYESELVNCTVSANTAYYYGGGAYLQNRGGARNSIVCGNTSVSGADYGNDVYGNLYWSMSNSLVDVEARFRDAANGDYRILPTSPAFDAGSLAFVSVDRDLAGTNRVWGDGVDIGCYEYHLPSGVSDPTNRLGVAGALAEEGYRGEYAAAVTTAKDYAYLVEWTARNGLSASDLNASPTGFLSPALDAEGLIELDPTNLVVQSFAPSTNGTWSLAAALPGFDFANAHLPLLQASFGVVGSETPDGDYTTNGLGFVVSPTATNVVVELVPPSASADFFLKATVR